MNALILLFFLLFSPPRQQLMESPYKGKVFVGYTNDQKTKVTDKIDLRSISDPMAIKERDTLNMEVLIKPFFVLIFSGTFLF